MRISPRATVVAAVCGLSLVLAGCTAQPASGSLVTQSAPPGTAARSTDSASSPASGSAVSGGAPHTAASPATGSGMPPPGGAASAAQAVQQAFVSVSARVLPSVVEIRTSEGLGSGIIFDTAGHIVTNHHVVGDSKTFQVRLSNGHAYNGTLTGGFPIGDLAVIQIKGAKDLHPAHFGDSSALKIGDIVLAVGNPLGLEGSVTEGVVSAVGRTMTEPQGPHSPGATLPNTIQTSAPINPGNSGGALVNLAGEVVGIPTLAATDAQEGGAAPGIGFAIPSNVVTDIAGQIIKYGEVRNSHRAALGIQATTVYDQQTGAPAGVGIVEVTKGGGAAKAGLKPGEVVAAIDGTGTPTTAALSQVLAQAKPGDTVKVTVLTQNGDRRTVGVTLGQLPG